MLIVNIILTLEEVEERPWRKRSQRKAPTFAPTFEEVPAHMAGRSILVNDLKHTFDPTERHPNLTTAITGVRGTGKRPFERGSSVLEAMLEDDIASTIEDMAQHPRKTLSYATQCKNRLLSQGIIEESAGSLRLRLPLMRGCVAQMAG